MLPPGSQLKKPVEAGEELVTALEQDGKALRAQVKQICTGEFLRRVPTADHVKL